MKNLNLLLIISFISIVACAQKHKSIIIADDPKTIDYTTEVVVNELDIHWGFVFLPDGSMLITEKSGELIHYNAGVKTKIKGLPEVYLRGQGGLMDIELHPNYRENGWLYITYSSSDGEGEGGNTTLIRAQLIGTKLTSVERLYKAEPNSKRGQHFGSRIEFDKDGYLYFSIGDRGNRDVNPQDITRDCGKIYRLNDDGSIPNDNPFLDFPGAKTAIYSYGHRNPQGMICHPDTGEIWVHEHGPRGGDEINRIKKGGNFGWPLISYGINYLGTSFTDDTDLPGMEQPLFYWVPSIAPSGMAYITSDMYKDWKNNLLIGSLKFEYIERLVLKNNKVVKREKILEGMGRVRNVRQGIDGYVYASLEGVGIVKIIPNK